LGHVERTTEIKAPVEKVWAILTDWDRLREWAKSVEKFEVTSKQRSGVGMTFHEVGVLAGRRYDVHSEVVEFEENKIFAWRTKVFGAEVRASWRLKPTEVGAQLTYTSDYKEPYSIFGILIDRLLFRGRSEKQVDGWMENIKSLAEK